MKSISNFNVCSIYPSIHKSIPIWDHFNHFKPALNLLNLDMNPKILELLQLGKHLTLYPVWAVRFLQAKNHGLRFRGAGSHPHCFTLSHSLLTLGALPLLSFLTTSVLQPCLFLLGLRRTPQELHLKSILPDKVSNFLYRLTTQYSCCCS